MSENKLFIPDSKPSADRNKRLIIGSDNARSFDIYASRWMNYSGIYLEKGTYEFKYSNLKDWRDASKKSGVNGWFDQKSWINWTHWVSRFPSAHLYSVIGGIHNQRKSQFDMGELLENGKSYSVAQGNEGELYAFANDIYFMYFNNHGQVTITVERID